MHNLGDEQGDQDMSKDERKKTYIAYLLDETGSMAPYADSTLKAMDAYIAELQSEDKDDTWLTLALFNSHRYDVVLDNIPVKEYERPEYKANYSTPLYDSIARLVDHVKQTRKKKQAVLFVIQTDGYENASKEHNKETITTLIKELQDEKGWQFVFLGANIDAYDQGIALGIKGGNTLQVTQGQEDLMAQELGTATKSYRSGGSMSTGQFFDKTVQSTARKRAFDPAAHPRDEKGRFVSKTP